MTIRKRVRPNGLCPPHHWNIDSNNYGRCIRPGCGVERDFAILQQRPRLKSEKREIGRVIAGEREARYKAAKLPF
jgi:hypothetical protein